MSPRPARPVLAGSVGRAAALAGLQREPGSHQGAVGPDRRERDPEPPARSAVERREIHDRYGIGCNDRCIWSGVVQIGLKGIRANQSQWQGPGGCRVLEKTQPRASWRCWTAGLFQWKITGTHRFYWFHIQRRFIFKSQCQINPRIHD